MMQHRIHNFRNYQTINPGIGNCTGCNEDCLLVYDSHHDEYFSLNCGTVKMQNHIELINTTPDDVELELTEKYIDLELESSWLEFIFKNGRK